MRIEISFTRLWSLSAEINTEKGLIANEKKADSFGAETTLPSQKLMESTEKKKVPWRKWFAFFFFGNKQLFCFVSLNK